MVNRVGLGTKPLSEGIGEGLKAFGEVRTADRVEPANPTSEADQDPNRRRPRSAADIFGQPEHPAAPRLPTPDNE